VCDRILILRDGELSAWVKPDSPRFTQRDLLADLQRPIIDHQKEAIT
jgi:hypothetical protein